MEINSGGKRLSFTEVPILEFDAKMDSLANCYVVCGPGTPTDRLCFGPFNDEADAWLYITNMFGYTGTVQNYYYVVRVINTDTDGRVIVQGEE